MRSHAILLALALVVSACGKDDPAKKNNVADAGPNNNADGGPNNVADMGSNQNPGDMAVGNDMGSVPDGSTPDATGSDMGGDVSGDMGGMGICGDGVVDWRLQETCDDGNTVDGDGCSAMCIREVPANCGDGVLDANEDCDDGMRNSDRAPDACRTNCTDPACGDSVADRGEECDDGNNRDGDGCAADCTSEVGAGCGDGTVDIPGGEECDDGNNTAGDGCSATCQLEPPGRTCGDSILDALEACDDGNTTNGDGCNSTCNLLGDVTTLAPGVTGQGALAVGPDELWLSQDFQIGFVALDAACINQDICSVQWVAGTGVQGHMDSADGATALIGFSEAMATDGNTLWFFDARTLRAMSTTAPYAVTTIAGDISTAPNNCVVTDGIGAAAGFYGTRGLTYYNGMLYFLDGCTGVLRTVDPVTAEVRTIAGTQWVPANPAEPMCPMGAPAGYTCGAGAAADGFGRSGAMVSPRYMASDNAGMLYITDTNGETLRTYNTVTGYLGTLAGGTQGYNDGVGAAAQLERPRGLTSDGASLYFSEQREHTVRQVEVSTATVSTLAGRRACMGNTDGIGGNGQTSNCNANPLNHAEFNTPFSIGYHFRSRALYVRDANGLRRVE